jgi:hypothetical protein
MEVSGQLYAPAVLPPGKEVVGTHFIGAWMGPQTGMDDLEGIKILPRPGIEPNRPAHNLLLCQLSCPGSGVLNIWVSQRKSNGRVGKITCIVFTLYVI